MPQDLRHDLIALLPRLCRFARGLTGAADQADDLVQASVEKALRNLDGFTRGTRMDAWMFRIIRNTWIDTIRARRDTVEFDAEAAATIIGSDGRATTEAHLHLAEVRRAMASLPEEQRAVLMLVCVEGMRYREVAEVLDIPEGTVMSRLSRARLALAEKLKDRPVGAQQQGITK
ncbi:RNA polymerase sigma factor [Yoonia sp.]|uniref:RNA polymerase sigma factor n=1 Tax=Yoonia sp. TaxID=2212373 RepID=UPI00391B0E15